MNVKRPLEIENAINQLTDYLQAPNTRVSFYELVDKFDAALCKPETIEFLKDNKKAQEKIASLNMRITDEIAEKFTGQMASSYSQLENEIKNKTPFDKALEKTSDQIAKTTNFQTKYIQNHILSIKNDDQRNITVERYIYTAQQLSEQGNFASAYAIYSALTKIDPIYNKVFTDENGNKITKSENLELIKDFDKSLSQQASITWRNYLFSLYNITSANNLRTKIENHEGTKIPPLGTFNNSYEMTIAAAKQNLISNKITKDEFENIKKAKGDSLVDFLSKNLILPKQNQNPEITATLLNPDLEKETIEFSVLSKVAIIIRLNASLIGDASSLGFEKQKSAKDIATDLDKIIDNQIEMFKSLNENNDINEMQDFYNRLYESNNTIEHKDKVLDNYNEIMRKLNGLKSKLQENREIYGGKDGESKLKADIDEYQFADNYSKISSILTYHDEGHPGEIQKSIWAQSERKKLLQDQPFISRMPENDVIKIYKYMEKNEQRVAKDPNNAKALNKLNFLKNIMGQVSNMQARGIQGKQIADFINNEITRSQQGYSKLILISDPENKITGTELYNLQEKHKNPILLKRDNGYFIYGLNQFSLDAVDKEFFSTIKFPDNTSDDPGSTNNISTEMRNEINKKTGYTPKKIINKDAKAIRLLEKYEDNLKSLASESNNTQKNVAGRKRAATINEYKKPEVKTRKRASSVVDTTSSGEETKPPVNASKSQSTSTSTTTSTNTSQANMKVTSERKWDKNSVTAEIKILNLFIDKEARDSKNASELLAQADDKLKALENDKTFMKYVKTNKEQKTAFSNLKNSIEDLKLTTPKKTTITQPTQSIITSGNEKPEEPELSESDELETAQEPNNSNGTEQVQPISQDFPLENLASVKQEQVEELVINQEANNQQPQSEIRSEEELNEVLSKEIAQLDRYLSNLTVILPKHVQERMFVVESFNADGDTLKNSFGNKVTDEDKIIADLFHNASTSLKKLIEIKKTSNPSEKLEQLNEWSKSYNTDVADKCKAQGLVNFSSHYSPASGFANQAIQQEPKIESQAENSNNADQNETDLNHINAVISLLENQITNPSVFINSIKSDISGLENDEKLLLETYPDQKQRINELKEKVKNYDETISAALMTTLKMQTTRNLNILTEQYKHLFAEANHDAIELLMNKMKVLTSIDQWITDHPNATDTEIQTKLNDTSEAFIEVQAALTKPEDMQEMIDSTNANIDAIKDELSQVQTQIIHYHEMINSRVDEREEMTLSETSAYKELNNLGIQYGIIETQFDAFLKLHIRDLESMQDMLNRSSPEIAAEVTTFKSNETYLASLLRMEVESDSILNRINGKAGLSSELEKLSSLINTDNNLSQKRAKSPKSTERSARRAAIKDKKMRELEKLERRIDRRVEKINKLSVDYGDMYISNTTNEGSHNFHEANDGLTNLTTDLTNLKNRVKDAKKDKTHVSSLRAELKSLDETIKQKIQASNVKMLEAYKPENFDLNRLNYATIKMEEIPASFTLTNDNPELTNQSQQELQQEGQSEPYASNAENRDLEVESILASAIPEKKRSNTNTISTIISEYMQFYKISNPDVAIKQLIDPLNYTGAATSLTATQESTNKFQPTVYKTTLNSGLIVASIITTKDSIPALQVIFDDTKNYTPQDYADWAAEDVTRMIRYSGSENGIKATGELPEKYVEAMKEYCARMGITFDSSEVILKADNIAPMQTVAAETQEQSAEEIQPLRVQPLGVQPLEESQSQPHEPQQVAESATLEDQPNSNSLEEKGIETLKKRISVLERESVDLLTTNASVFNQVSKILNATREWAKQNPNALESEINNKLIPLKTIELFISQNNNNYQQKENAKAQLANTIEKYLSDVKDLQSENPSIKDKTLQKQEELLNDLIKRVSSSSPDNTADLEKIQNELKPILATIQAYQNRDIDFIIKQFHDSTPSAETVDDNSNNIGSNKTTELLTRAVNTAIHICNNIPNKNVTPVEIDFLLNLQIKLIEIQQDIGKHPTMSNEASQNIYNEIEPDLQKLRMLNQNQAQRIQASNVVQNKEQTPKITSTTKPPEGIIRLQTLLEGVVKECAELKEKYPSNATITKALEDLSSLKKTVYNTEHKDINPQEIAKKIKPHFEAAKMAGLLEKGVKQAAEAKEKTSALLSEVDINHKQPK